MASISDEIVTNLSPLIGLKLAVARSAGDMRNFQFGEMRPVDKGTVGQYALHIQCPWRIEGPDGMVTERADLLEPARVAPVLEFDGREQVATLSLQDSRLADLLKGYDPKTHSFVNETNNLVVESVAGDDSGGAALNLSGGYRLMITPARDGVEDWRLFRPRSDDPHFIINDGQIERDH